MPVPDLEAEAMAQGYAPTAPEGAVPAPQPQPAPHPAAHTAPPRPVPVDDGGDEDDEDTPFYRRVVFWIIVAAALILVAAAIIFLLPRLRGGGKAACSHVWAEATCLEPKTCTICGETEGEPLGHDFQDNFCTVCGASERPFLITDIVYERVGDHYLFSGTLQNCTEEPVKDVKLQVMFLDGDHNVTESDEVVVADQAPLSPREEIQWSYSYMQPYLNARYFRASVVDFATDG